MSPPVRRAAQASSERGSVTLYTMITVVALFAGAGLVADGGAAMAAKAAAIGDAYAAARAGAQALARSAYAASGTIAADPAAARAAALAYLDAAGVPTGARVTVAGATVHVQVSLATPTHLLDAFGLARITVTGTGSASALYYAGGPG